jgi:uncharacterized repeat protein (TIGR01451 family)
MFTSPPGQRGPRSSGPPAFSDAPSGAYGAFPASPTRIAAVVAVLILALLGLALVPGRAAAAPGVPAAPRTIYTEDFESGLGTAPVLINAYTGASGQRYTADPAWLTGCNGLVVAFAAPDAPIPAGCEPNGAYDRIRQIAHALSGNTTNRAVSAYTEGDPGVDLVQFETATPIPLAARNRFITFGVDAAETNCFGNLGNHALLKFYLVDGAAEIPTFTRPIEPCDQPDSENVTVPAVGGSAEYDYVTGSYASDRAVLFTGSELGIRLRNGQGSGNGNDAGFDNIRVLDATPQLDKAFSDAERDPGQTSRLTFTITNTSELGEKAGWAFTDTLSPGLRVADPASATTTCANGSVTVSPGADAITATGDLAQGDVSCTVSVDVTSTRAGTYTNGPANLTLTGLDAPAAATISFGAADLSIVKSAAPTTAILGANQTYELAVTNTGPDAAENVRVTDVLPSGLTFVSASPECALVSATVACTVPSIASGATRTFTVTAKVDAAPSGLLSNTATVASDVRDPDPSDNTSTVAVPVERRADLSITKTASARTVAPNGQVLYTLVVRNDGPSDATGVTVVDAPSSGLTLLSADAGAGATCDVVADRATCQVGTVAAGATAQVLVTARTSGTALGDLTNRATVAGDEPDPNPDSNAATSTITVAPAPPAASPVQPSTDLSISKTVDARRIRLGQALTYTVVVTNSGSTAASDVVVTDTLGVPARNVSIRTSAGTCRGTVSFVCRLGTIAPGQKATITVKLTPTKAGAARNTASVTFAGADPRTGNNTAAVTTAVDQPTLGLTQRADRKAVRAGGTVTYTLRVRNPSSAAVRHVTVCADLPAGLIHVGSKSRAKRTKGQYCWTVRSLGAGKSRTFTLTARALRGTSGTKTSRATASARGARAKRTSHSVRVTRAALRAGGVTG